jgi:hypothetical protein
MHNTMSNQNTIEILDLGFRSWLELYEWLKEQGLQDDKTFTLTWENQAITEERTTEAGDDGPLPEIEVRPDVTLPTNIVKARAFQELYDSLPSKKSLDVVEAIIFAEEKVQMDVETIQTFFKNLPTRSE